MENNFEYLSLELYSLIKEISNFQQKIHLKWRKISQKNYSVNFKNKKVDDVNNDELFYLYVSDYRKMIQDPENITDLIVLKANYTALGQLDYRIKENDSWMDKLNRYQNGDLKGKIPLNKCLNDLVGFRISLKINIDREKIIERLTELCSHNGMKNIKIIDSSKNGYFAVHIYIKDTNKEPSWELQIWNHEDIANNIDSHKTYKQDYNKFNERK